MTDSELKNGQVYWLTCDVKNPAPDLRGKNFRRVSLGQSQWAEKMEVWPAGMRFRYTEREETFGDRKITVRAIENFDGRYQKEIFPMARDASGTIIIPNPKWVALVPALTPAPEDLDTVLDALGPYGREVADQILAVLFEHGKVTREDLASAYAEVERQDAEP